MKYEISYNAITNQQIKRTKAIEDIKNYLTAKQLVIIETIAMDATQYSHLSFACSFAGISGYPVVALWDETRQTMRDMTS